MRRVFSWTGLIFVLLFAARGLAQPAAERSSATDEQLKRLLERFPQADLNRDGVLTQREARTYREQLQTQRKQPPAVERPQPTEADVKYGPHDRHVLDFWKAKSDQPTPVIVFIHGGGFVGGSKNGVSAALLKKCLDEEISVASIHYRFVTTDPFPAPQHDGARAIQFLRHQAKDWNIDPERMAAYGGSAGAGISLWLAFHNDLADPQSDDPVLRQSSRVAAVGSFGGQTSYDPHVIEAWIGGRANEHPSVFKCYGVRTLEELNDPKLQPLYDEVSAIKHLTADDPPVYLAYNEPDRPLPENAGPGQGIHHPAFAHHLIAELKKHDIPYLYRHASEFRGDAHLDMLEFFKKYLVPHEAPAP